VDEIDDDPDAHAMSLIDEVFEVVGAATSGCHCKETSDVVSEGTIVSMFLAGHQLNHIITCLFDSW